MTFQLVEGVTGLLAKLGENLGQRAETRETCLKQVEPHEQGEQQKGRVDEMAQSQACDDKRAGEGDDETVDIHGGFPWVGFNTFKHLNIDIIEAMY
jgi:hypothetical protein